MLKDASLAQIRFIAILAKAARAQRDARLGHVNENALAEYVPARGAHNPTETLGYEPLSLDDPPVDALHKAIAALSEPARRELYTLMRIGQGQLTAKDWQRGLTEAETLGDETVTATLLEDADLHDHLAKGLYEAKLSA